MVIRILALFLITLICVNALLAQETIVTLPNGQKVILYEDKTWDYYEGIEYDYDLSSVRDHEIPGFLKEGIPADRKTIINAIKMYEQGWRYTMPRPKSSQAAWGNDDRRTTWWYGYWHNIKSNNFSKKTPEEQENGYFMGDKQNLSGM